MLIKMARAGMGWTAEELVKEARLSPATIRRAELAENTVSEGNLLMTQQAFERRGVVFVEENGNGGRGVRRPKRRAGDV